MTPIAGNTSTKYMIAAVVGVVIVVVVFVVVVDMAQAVDKASVE